MTLQLQIASDLHLEYDMPDDFKDIINPIAPILILPGDIGNLYKMEDLRKFITWCCDNFVAVLYVPGNHEFYKVYNYSPQEKYELDFYMKKIENQLPNLYILARLIDCLVWSRLTASTYIRSSSSESYQYVRV